MTHAWRYGSITWPSLGLLRWCSRCGFQFHPDLEEAACPGLSPVLPPAGTEPDTLHGVARVEDLLVLRWTGEAWQDVDGVRREPAQLAAQGWFWLAPARRLDVPLGSLGGLAAPSPGRSAKRVRRPENGSLFA